MKVQNPFRGIRFGRARMVAYRRSEWVLAEAAGLLIATTPKPFSFQPRSWGVSQSTSGRDGAWHSSGRAVPA